MNSCVSLLLALAVAYAPAQAVISASVASPLIEQQHQAEARGSGGARRAQPREQEAFGLPVPVLPYQTGPWSAFPDGEMLFQDLTAYLDNRTNTFETEARLPAEVGCDTQVYVTVFQTGSAPVRWGSKDCDATAALTRILNRIKENDRFQRSFRIDQRTRMLLEYTTASRSLSSVSDLAQDTISATRFEPGITGFRFVYGGRLFFYMPTEGYTRSHMTLKQAMRFLARRVGLRGPKAVRTFLRNVTGMHIIHSRAFLWSGGRVLPLYRGYPTPLPASEQAILNSINMGAEWIARNQRSNGQFLYYYDAHVDSTADFLHPKNPDYYNILRHSGGIITLLRTMELTGRDNYREAVRRAIEFLLSHSVSYQAPGEKRRYVFYNSKAKLGGSGLALVALMHHHRLTGDRTYLGYADELAAHLLSQILPDGEFLGYFIHPSFNDGRPLVDVSPEVRRELFSFYYPGEALLGLALYERYAPLEEQRRAMIRSKGRLALDFLIFERPKRYADMFLSLPADAWLMQAIEEWWYHPEMRNAAYARFVDSDALQMIEHMYQPGDAPYPDYVGHFYYVYGQHAIPDASRAEGLMAAFILARMRGESDLARLLLDKMWLTAVGLRQTFNSPEAMYAARRPEKAIGAFRFKLTRQWVRVDSVQHAVSFYARLLMALAAEERNRPD